VGKHTHCQTIAFAVQYRYNIFLKMRECKEYGSTCITNQIPTHYYRGSQVGEGGRREGGGEEGEEGFSDVAGDESRSFNVSNLKEKGSDLCSLKIETQFRPTCIRT
jgi:hypothetical protein